MANRTTTMGTLLLIGAVFLSLNALAVSARPGDVIQAEKTTAIASATAAIPEAATSGTVAPTGGVVAVPVPLPAQDPIVLGADPGVPTPAIVPIERPITAPIPGLEPPTANPRDGQNVSVGAGIVEPSPGMFPPVEPIYGFGPWAVPIPPALPGPGELNPVPIPPYGADPAHVGL